MSRILALVCFLCAQSALAAHTLVPKGRDALFSLSACAPKAEMACVMSGTPCTKAQFCAACTAVGSAKPGVCQDRESAFAAVEGVFGFTAGSCSQCGVGRSPEFIPVKGGTAMQATTGNAGGEALGIVLHDNGVTEIPMLTHGGEGSSKGAVALGHSALIAPGISQVAACIKAKGSSTTKGCFATVDKCNAKAISKATRCDICKSVKQCQDGEEFAESLFATECYGCK